jgi:hypothetical protein
MYNADPDYLAEAVDDLRELTTGLDDEARNLHDLKRRIDFAVAQVTMRNQMLRSSRTRWVIAALLVGLVVGGTFGAWLEHNGWI